MSRNRQKNRRCYGESYKKKKNETPRVTEFQFSRLSNFLLALVFFVFSVRFVVRHVAQQRETLASSFTLLSVFISIRWFATVKAYVFIVKFYRMIKYAYTFLYFGHCSDTREKMKKKKTKKTKRKRKLLNKGEYPVRNEIIYCYSLV